MLCACNEENVSSSSINSSKLTVNDAKTFFETSIQNNIFQKSLSRGINTEERKGLFCKHSNCHFRKIPCSRKIFQEYDFSSSKNGCISKSNR